MNPFSKLPILLVDDDELVLEMYRRVLGRQFNVRTALGAQQALDTLSSEGPFAVIMSDFKMPRITGVQLLRQVRKRWPEISRILVTGQLEVSELGEDLELASLLEKPCPQPELVRVLSKEIEAYEARVSVAIQS